MIRSFYEILLSLVNYLMTNIVKIIIIIIYIQITIQHNLYYLYNKKNI